MGKHIKNFQSLELWYNRFDSSANNENSANIENKDEIPLEKNVDTAERKEKK